MIVADGRVVLAQRAPRHQAEEKHTSLIVQRRGDVKIGEGGAEQVMNVGDSVDHSVGIDAVLTVEQGDHQRDYRLVRKDPSADDKSAAVAEETRLDHIERYRRLGQRLVAQQLLHPLPDLARVVLKVAERHGETGYAQSLD